MVRLAVGSRQGYSRFGKLTSSRGCSRVQAELAIHSCAATVVSGRGMLAVAVANGPVPKGVHAVL
jgi:hypothetical protein